MWTGASEILLDVPRYDFNWQNRYELAEPKHLPAGSRLRCTAVYDNSADNPANPDPTAEVRTGPQSWEEMFNGYFDVVLADEDLTQPVPLEPPLMAGRAAALSSGRLRVVPCLRGAVPLAPAHGGDAAAGEGREE